MHVNDLYALVYYHWALDTETFPHERYRVQLPLRLLMIAYTSSRPGAIIESGCYSETNEALRYKEVRVTIVRNPHEIGNNVMIFKPEDVYNLRVPAHLNSIQIKWKPGMQDKPIFRRALRTADGIRISLDKALAYDTGNKNLKRLGRSAGFNDNVTLYCLRRGVANVVDDVATTAERNQILGHSRAKIFNKYYLSQRVKRDVQSAYLGRPSKDSLVRCIGQMSITRDSRAPTALSSKQLSEIAHHPRMVELRAAKKLFRPSLDLYTLASKELASEQEYLRRSTLEQLRSKYFENADTMEIDQQLSGLQSSTNEEPKSEVIDFTFDARARLAIQLFQGQNGTARPSRVEVLKDL
ncbi:MAG: hypothetical protein M1816_004709, partial [Peltula sp. TS41687]